MNWFWVISWTVSNCVFLLQKKTLISLKVNFLWDRMRNNKQIYQLAQFKSTILRECKYVDSVGNFIYILSLFQEALMKTKVELLLIYILPI